MKHEVLYHTTAFLHSFLHVSHCCVHLEEVFNKLPATCQLQAATIGMPQAAKLRNSCNWQLSPGLRGQAALTMRGLSHRPRWSPSAAGFHHIFP